MSSINIAILGAGIFAKQAHIPAINKAEGLVLKAVYSRSKSSAISCIDEAKKLNPALEAVECYYDVDGSSKAAPEQSLAKLLSRDDIHAVIVALPIMQQPDVIKKCFEAGKHVLSEKPIGPTVESAQRLLKLYRTSYPKLIWSVAENFHHENGLAYAAEQVKSLGKVTFFTFTWAICVEESNKYYQTTWRKTPDYQGGFLLDGGVHFAAQLRKVVGQNVVKVAAFGRKVQEHLPPVDTLSATCFLADGAAGTFTLSAASKLGINELVVVCEKGAVTVKTGNDIARGKSAPLRVTNSATGEEKGFEFSGVDNEVAVFAKEVATLKQGKDSSPEEAVSDLGLIQALLTSSDNKGALTSVVIA